MSQAQELLRHDLVEGAVVASACVWRVAGVSSLASASLSRAGTVAEDE